VLISGMQTATQDSKKKGLEAMTKDPVCGMTVDETTAVHAERDGKTFYFCSDRCLKTFSSAASTSEASKSGGRCGCSG
jgi:YHS domain-containing protein